MDEDLLRLLYNAGFTTNKGLAQAYAVAMAESGGRPQAYNDNRDTGDDSYGLFQINMIDNLGPARNAKFKDKIEGYKKRKSLFDPNTNAKAAAYMSQGGKDWSSWSTYGGDRYNEYLVDPKSLNRYTTQWSKPPVIPNGAQLETDAGLAKPAPLTKPILPDVDYLGPKPPKGDKLPKVASVTTPASNAVAGTTPTFTTPNGSMVNQVGQQFAPAFTGASIQAKVV